MSRDKVYYAGVDDGDSRYYSQQKRRLAQLNTVSSSVYPISRWIYFESAPDNIDSFALNDMFRSTPPSIREEGTRSVGAIMAKKLRIRFFWPVDYEVKARMQNRFTHFRIVIAWVNAPTTVSPPLVYADVAPFDSNWELDLPFSQSLNEPFITRDGSDNKKSYYVLHDEVWKPYKTTDHTPEIRSTFPKWETELEEACLTQPFGRPKENREYLRNATGFDMQGWASTMTINREQTTTDFLKNDYFIQTNQLLTGFPLHSLRAGLPNDALEGGGGTISPNSGGGGTIADIVGGGGTVPGTILPNAGGGGTISAITGGGGTIDPFLVHNDHGWGFASASAVQTDPNSGIWDGRIGGTTAAGDVVIGTQRRPLCYEKEPAPAYLPKFGETTPYHDSKRWEEEGGPLYQVWNTRMYEPEHTIELDLDDEIVTLYGDYWDAATNSWKPNNGVPASTPLNNQLRVFIMSDSPYGAAYDLKAGIGFSSTLWFKEVYDC